MRRLRSLWLPLIALAALAVAVVLMQGRTGLFGPFGSADQEARAPDAAPQTGRDDPRLKTPPPVQEPFAFKASREGERVVLSGLVARDETRLALIEEAKQAVPNALVSDELKTSDKAPRGTDQAAASAIRHLTRLPSGVVTLREGTIALTGQAPDREAYTALAGAPTPEGFRLDTAGLIPPLAQPYTWSAASNEGALVLAGHVPSEAFGHAIAVAAREAFPDRQVAEGFWPASGVPSGIDFHAAARFALTQLAQLRIGTAELVDTTLSLKGDVTDQETLASVRVALQTGLPPGLQAGSVALTLRRPSPYTFRVRREAGTLTLTGFCPDAETRAAIHQLIRQRFFSEQIVDRLRIADGAPQNYLAGVSFGLEHLARLASGEVAVNGASLHLSGESLYEQSAEQMVQTVAAMSVRGWTGKADVRVRPSGTDAAQLRAPQP